MRRPCEFWEDCVDLDFGINIDKDRIVTLRDLSSRHAVESELGILTSLLRG